MKRILATALAVLLLLAALAGCATANPTQPPASPATTDKPAEPAPSTPAGPDTSEFVNVTWMYEGSAVVDDTAVMAKVNEYLKEKLNCSLTMLWQSWGDFDTKVMTSINAGDPVDIYFTSSWTADEYGAMAKKGAFLRLDDPANNLLEKNAPELLKTLPQILIDCAKTPGAAGVGIYAVPTYKEIAQQYVWSINSDLMAKYGYSINDLTDIYSLDPILSKIKQGEGADFYPINCDFSVWERAARNVDMVDASLLMDYVFDPVHPANSGTVITSAFESESMRKYLETMHDYYKKGYINPAATTNTQAMSQTWIDTKKSGKWAVDIYPYYPGNEYSDTSTYKYKFEVKPYSAGYISTTSAHGAMNAISTVSKNPDRALMVLNLVNIDAAFRTMLTYGLEGIHYTKGADGKISFTDEKNNYLVWAAGLGAISLLPLQEGQPDNLYTEIFPKFNNAEAVPIVGFVFDQTPVQTQIAALNNIQTQYEVQLFTGAADPAVVLPEFVAQLKANGLDDVLKEVNAQLQAFLAAKGK